MAVDNITIEDIDIVIDKDSFTPVYYQLAKSIENHILSGKLKPGDRIASETYLSETLNISRMTVRKAFEILAKKNLIYSERGKGTFVSKLNFSDAFFKITEFFCDTEDQGMIPNSKFLEAKIIDTPIKVANKLKIHNNKILFLSYLRLADDEPVVFERKYIVVTDDFINSHDELISVGSEAQNTSFSELIEKTTGVISLKTDITIKATLMNTEEAEFLGEKKGAPALMVEQQIYTANDEPVALGIYIYRGNKYKFSSSYSY